MPSCNKKNAVLEVLRVQSGLLKSCRKMDMISSCIMKLLHGHQMWTNPIKCIMYCLCTGGYIGQAMHRISVHYITCTGCSFRGNANIPSTCKTWKVPKSYNLTHYSLFFARKIVSYRSNSTFQIILLIILILIWTLALSMI